ncbi:MAG TPA: CHAT domain-containing protein, partial [Acidimicrobiales bacterium]|nr:CHAT domain-containing protein [Acidimicrobiales bacterium]
VIAPVMPVPDDATATLMVAVHDRLRAGAPPAAALAEAAAASRATGQPLDVAAAAAFVCIASDA